MKLTWKNSLSVGIAEIDEQHKGLIRMTNDLHQAMEAGHSQDIIMSIVERMANYTVEHFSTEERWFKCYEYPDAEAHIKRHQVFVQKVLEFKQMLDDGQIGLGIQISLFISDWLKNHIGKEDLHYGRYFQKIGVTNLEQTAC